MVMAITVVYLPVNAVFAEPRTNKTRRSQLKSSLP